LAKKPGAQASGFFYAVTNRALWHHARVALKATICKAVLQIADMDRSYYGDHSLTIAQHPSETAERMMVRLLAFALHADDALAFGKGLSTDDEPDLWRKDLTGAIALWVDVGLPDEKRIRKACGRAGEVLVYCYGGHAVRLWWEQSRDKLSRMRNLTVKAIDQPAGKALAALGGRNMQLSCSIQEGQIWMTDGIDSVHAVPEILQAPHMAAG
jgi:uncharacterized protein YaeQ